MGIRSRIAVDYPDEPARFCDDQVRIGIPFEKARQRRHTVADVAPDQHSGLAGDVSGEQKLTIAFSQSRGHPRGEITDRDSAGSFIFRVDIAAAGWVIELG